ncbi:unnamed protein product [Linum trigynum]|uniref:Uncharacterized protein n=1 Tax=Linum trigynum TaxID=586398 RepID=A0AAV2CH52_9ROSI
MVRPDLSDRVRFCQGAGQADRVLSDMSDGGENELKKNLSGDEWNSGGGFSWAVAAEIDRGNGAAALLAAAASPGRSSAEGGWRQRSFAVEGGSGGGRR